MSAEPSSTLFVGNLSWSATEDTLRSVFPSATGARIVQSEGRSKGFGYVEFASIDDARRAMEANNNMELEGRAIRLDFSAPRAPRAPRASPPMRSPSATNPPAATLFVGNLSFDTNEASLRAAFHGCKGVRLVTDRETGKPRGFGYVEYDSVEAARRAFDAMNGAEVDGRSVRLDYAQAQSPSGRPRLQAPQNPPSSTLFVGNLSYECSEEHLRACFAEAGAIQSIRIVKDETGASKGFGYVQFNDVETAQRAMEKEGTEICGRRVHLDYAAPRPEREARPAREARAPAAPRAPTNAPAPTLYLGGLNYNITEADVRAAFARFGTIAEVRLMKEKDGKPKGFGYLTFSNVAEAQAALTAMNGQNLNERALRLDFAAPRPERPAREIRRSAPREDPMDRQDRKEDRRRRR